MAINNIKRKKSDDIKLADQEPQKEQKPERGPGFGDTKNDGAGIDIIPTADYKINRDGKKYKAHRIVFSNGHDDGKKGVSEMKKTLAQFVEELKGNQVKLDKNKNGKLDAEDFKKLRSKGKMEEEAEELDEVDQLNSRHQVVLNRTPAGKAREIQRNREHLKSQMKTTKSMGGLAGPKGKLPEEFELDEAIHADDYTATSEKSTMNNGHRPHVVNKETGRTMMLGQHSYKSPEHAKAHAKAYLTAYANKGMHAADRANLDYAKANKQHMVQEDTEMNEELHPAAGKVLKHIKPEHHAKYTPDMTTKHYTDTAEDRLAVLRAAKKAGHLKDESMNESWEDMLAYSKEMSNNANKSKTRTYHDVKKISTGTVYTKQFDKDGTSKGTGGDAAAKAENAPKRGRGRPKKDKFAESVNILLSLSEEQFDSMMEEGFDAFFEAFEQLDELSKTTLGSYAKKASRDAVIKRKIAADFENKADKSRSSGMKDAATRISNDYKSKSFKRSDGVNKAIDRLTK
jgi:hypothetical protein